MYKLIVEGVCTFESDDLNKVLRAFGDNLASGKRAYIKYPPVKA